MRPLGISIYEDKIVQLALKKILEAIMSQSLKRICMDSEQTEDATMQLNMYIIKL